MAKKKSITTSITMLKGPDKVRKRPGVIFGSDGVDGCAHSVFEIVSNSIDEARSGFGDKIIVTQYNDHSITVEDFGRGCPVTLTARKTALTGSWCSVNCMPAESITPMATTTPILWA